MMRNPVWLVLFGVFSVVQSDELLFSRMIMPKGEERKSRECHASIPLKPSRQPLPLPSHPTASPWELPVQLLISVATLVEPPLPVSNPLVACPKDRLATNRSNVVAFVVRECVTKLLGKFVICSKVYVYESSHETSTMSNFLRMWLKFGGL